MYIIIEYLVNEILFIDYWQKEEIKTNIIKIGTQTDKLWYKRLFRI